MSVRRLIAFFLLLLTATGVGALQPLDLTFSLAGSSLAAAGLLMADGVSPVSEEQRRTLRTADLPPIDRDLVFPDDPLLGGISDIVVYGQALAPVGIAAFGMERQDARDLLARHFQVLTITYGSTYLLKAAVWRARPFLYFSNVAPLRVADPAGANSFPSSHVAIAFASAAFISTVADQYWDERYTKMIIFGSYAIASLSAVLRIAAGRHFVSDVLAGALLGMVVGWSVPTAHAISAR